MFDYEPAKEKEPVDYTGLKIVAVLAPVFFLITFLSNADMALTVVIVLGVIVLAIKLRWHLRKHLWFWATIVVLLAIHIPLVFIVRWPQGSLPTRFYTVPIGIIDFFITLVAIDTVEKFFSKDSGLITIGKSR